MAFHAFHTLSFPWPALGRDQNVKLPKIPFLGDFPLVAYPMRDLNGYRKVEGIHETLLASL